MIGSPGIAFQAVLDAAPLSYIRRLLGEHACELLTLLREGSVEDAIRKVAASAVSPEQLIGDPEERAQLLELLPEGKKVELAERLGWDNSSSPTVFLSALPWTLEERRVFLGFLGLVVDRAPEAPVSSRRPSEPSYGLFPHQRRAAGKVRRLLYSGERRTVLHLPTGVGKTRTGMDLICDHLRQHEPTLVVWLARGRELLEQAALEFERAWASLGNREVTVARMWGDAPTDLDDITDGIVVLGLEKAGAAAKSTPGFLDQLALRTTLTVFDEAHQAIAPTYRRVVEALTLRSDSSLLGLTATPGRTWADISEDEKLADFFARQKVMLEIDGYDNPVTALIEQGYLARPDFRTVAADSGMKLSARDKQALAASFDIPDELITRLADNVQWNLQVVRTVLDLSGQHRRILLFAASIEHSRLIVAILSMFGIDAEQVTGESSTRHRDRVINRFKGPGTRPMVLSNYGVLTTGFDAPAASAAVIARPTRSLVLYSQMVGRVIRGPKAGGTSTCDVVTVVDPALPGFGDVAEAFTNWEDVWKAL
ncbi:DEAD/DEAH box helicase [Streptomyces clavuligerus]|uniref:Type III restriction protein res subunit n=1 Tax=Streptomyces clavuligerus TaxID=1901 RepID=E2Q9L6_STRCL|nr:DEAD/DEAH box helicase family protein [Streptomyces clavuligerus]ANW19591.1 restriction endonuclease [Streptomyces clavuligerus]AXU14196.1 restriction endonuclease [Streptomyces clavuligerus]EFG07593.1 Type III restriction protein res subunit [Streptomyces clavuligerus]MBY6304194.1 DEAD/DEAH box helicase family protein [Streptomyces clavuligerus]QCS06970.1 restriction endonuclease [Streptomyces clavuligerus]